MYRRLLELQRDIIECMIMKFLTRYLASLVIWQRHVGPQSSRFNQDFKKKTLTSKHSSHGPLSGQLGDPPIFSHRKFSNYTDLKKYTIRSILPLSSTTWKTCLESEFRRPFSLTARSDGFQLTPTSTSPRAPLIVDMHPYMLGFPSSTSIAE